MTILYSLPGMSFHASGSLRNKFAILSVEAPVWQGTKVQEYQADSELS